MITFETKEKAQQFTTEWNFWLNNVCTPESFTEYVKLNKTPEYDLMNIDEKQQLKLANTPATKEPHPDRLSEMMSEVLFEMFLLSSPNYK
jgi:hypothetical protein